MDMLLLFMMFCTLPPFFLWSRRKTWAVIHMPFIIGMWAYFECRFFHIGLNSTMQLVLLILFFANLVMTEFSLIRYCVDIGNEMKQKRSRAVPTRKQRA